jgi:hypothetical protein
MHNFSRSSTVRYALGGLLAFGALNAFGGGYYGLSGAKGVPVEWLQGSPFSDYTVPSLILFVIVGGSFLTAAIAVFARARIARASGLIAGAIVLIWIAIQIAIIGYVSWMQPATAIGGTGILFTGVDVATARFTSAPDELAIRLHVVAWLIHPPVCDSNAVMLPFQTVRHSLSTYQPTSPSVGTNTPSRVRYSRK